MIKVVTIFWVDSAMHSNEQIYLKEAQSKSLVDVISSGILVAEYEDRIILTMDSFMNGNEVRHVSVFPKACIKRIIRHKIK